MTKELEHGSDLGNRVDGSMCRTGSDSFPVTQRNSLWKNGNEDFFAAKQSNRPAAQLPSCEIDFGQKTVIGSSMPEIEKDESATIKSSGKANEIAENATPQERAAFMCLQENRGTFDLKKIWDPQNRVLAIGDQHLTLDIKEHTAKHMQAYKDAGASAVGMELFRQDAQGDLDAYADIKNNMNATEQQKSAARKKVEGWIHESQATSTDTPDDLKTVLEPVEKTMQIIDAAIDNRMKVIAIEPNIPRQFSGEAGYTLMHQGIERLKEDSTSDFETYTNPRSSEEERQQARSNLQSQVGSWDHSDQFFKTMDQAIKAGFNFKGMKLPVGSEESDFDFDRRLHENRNKTWADVASKYLEQNQGSRLLLFAGMQHFEYGNREKLTDVSANERLQEHGFGTTVLQFAGGEYAKSDVFESELKSRSQWYANRHNLPLGTLIPDSEQNAGLRYTKPAQAARVDHLEFVLRLHPDAVRSGDFIVHLPQQK